MTRKHQAKRPYNGSQPSITSYFSTASSPTNSSLYSLPPTQAQDFRSQGIPANVQSNLLNVGMRVRKSVPEGYKTGTYCAKGIFEDNTPAITTTVRQPDAPSPQSPNSIKTRPRAGALAGGVRERELMPFCGLSKVGGLAMQQQWGAYLNTTSDDQFMEGDDVPVLSQGSTISNDSVDLASLGSNKRRFLDDDDVVLDSHSQLDGVGLIQRPIAVPKRKKGIKPSVRILGQENMGQDIDFDDAEFLDYGLVDEQMGGCA